MISIIYLIWHGNSKCEKQVRIDSKNLSIFNKVRLQMSVPVKEKYCFLKTQHQDETLL